MSVAGEYNKVDKKRIALVVNTLSSGGAEHVAANLSRALSDRFEVDLILNDDVNISYPYSGNIISVGMPAGSDRMSAKYQMTALVKRTSLLKRLKRRRQYAATISFSDNTNLSNVLSRSSHGLTIISLRNSLEGRERSGGRSAYPRRLILRICCALADKTVSCSEEIDDAIRVRNLKNSDRLAVIYNGVDLQSIRSIEEPEERTEIRGRAGDGLSVVMAGRMTEQKAQWHMLYALRELRARGIRPHLTILGDGPLRKDLEKLCCLLGIDDQVSMPGWVHDPYRYFKAADAVVCTSAYEGFCNVILEAMACGAPCISTDHKTGAREILAPGTDWKKKTTDHAEYAEYGILVPVCGGDQSDLISNTYNGSARKILKGEIILADALQELLTNSELAERYVKAGMKRAQELSLEAAADKWAALLQ